MTAIAAASSTRNRTMILPMLWGAGRATAMGSELFGLIDFN